VPELVSNDYKRPLLSSSQLINFLTLHPWTTQWPGSSGGNSVREIDGKPTLVIGCKANATEQSKNLIRLRLTTEGKIPDEQVVCE
jgi:hypothetical protein